MIEDKKDKIKSNFEVLLRVGFILLFVIFWFNYGFDIAKSYKPINDFVSKYIGTGNFLSKESLIFALVFFSILAYPMLIAFFIGFTIFDKAMFRELSTSKNFIYFVLSPMLIILLMLFMVIFRFATGIFIYSLFFGYPIYLVVTFVYNKCFKR